MASEDLLEGIDRRFPWSFLGFVTGLVFGLFGIYSIFFYEKKPDVRIEILSNAPLYTIQEDVPDLEITFAGNNIRESRQSLSLITFRLVNRGNVPLTTAAFDEKDPLILNVKHGELIRSDVLDSSGDYFQKVFKDVRVGRTGLTFPKFIMEPEEFIVVKALVLHGEGQLPSLETSGKIANLGTVAIIDSSASIGGSAGKQSAVRGDFRAQAIRVVVYGLGTVVGIAALVGLAVLIKNVFDSIRWHRRSSHILRAGHRLLSRHDPETRQKLTYFLSVIAQVPSSLEYLVFRVFESTSSNEQRADSLRNWMDRYAHFAPHARSMVHPNILVRDAAFMEKLEDFIKELGKSWERERRKPNNGFQRTPWNRRL